MNALMINSDSPRFILTANKIINSVPHINTQSIPYELWKGRNSNLKYSKVLWCLAIIEVPLPKKMKIGLKMVDCVFIEYVVNSKAYRLLVPKSDNLEINVNTIIESDNAEFF